MHYEFDTRQPVHEAFDVAELRRKRREIEFKRLQTEASNVEVQRAQLQQAASRARPRGRGMAPPNKYSQPPLGVGNGRGHSGGRGGTGAKPSAARRQRRGQGSLERRREARAAAREAALAVGAAGNDPLGLASLPTNFTSRSSSVLLPTAPVFEPGHLREWQDRHRTQPESKWLDSESGRTAPIAPRDKISPAYSHFSGGEQQPMVEGRNPTQTAKQLPEHDSSSQMGSAKWAGWTMICDMLNDSEPSNRASAVNTLRVMTDDASMAPQTPVSGSVVYATGTDEPTARQPFSHEASSEMHEAFAYGAADGNFPGRVGKQHHGQANEQEQKAEWQGWNQQRRAHQHRDMMAQREEACQAVLEHGAVGQLVDLLKSEENVSTQIAATQVLRNVFTHVVRQPSPTDGHADEAHSISTPCNTDGPDYSHGNIEGPWEDDTTHGPRAVSPSRSGQLPVKTILEETDIVTSIVNLMESDDAVVRSSALGTVAELSYASEQARQHFFQQPTLLPHLLDVVEQANLPLQCFADDSPDVIDTGMGLQLLDQPVVEVDECPPALDDGAEQALDHTIPTMEVLTDEEDTITELNANKTPETSTPETSGTISETQHGGTSAVLSSNDPMTGAAAVADRAQAVGVLKLMLDEEESAKRVRDAIATRPGVIESMVSVATLAPTPHEEAGLLSSQGHRGPMLGPHEEAQAAHAANKALVGLAGSAREVAVNAVVNVLGHKSDGAGPQSCGSSAQPLGLPLNAASQEQQSRPPANPVKSPHDSTGSDDVRERMEVGNAATNDSHSLTVDGNSYVADTRMSDDLDLVRCDARSTPPLSESTQARGQPGALDGSEHAHVVRRRQLAAMATLRSLVTTPDPTAEGASIKLPDRASLRAVRNARGVDAVVSLLGNNDPSTQASASLTLMAMVKADDEAKTYSKRAVRRRRRDDGHISESSPERAGVTQDDAPLTHIDTELGDDANARTCDEVAVVEAQDDCQVPAAESAEDIARAVSPHCSIDDFRLETGNDMEHTRTDGNCLRAQIAGNELAIPRLVSVISRGKEQPQAAVQAAATLTALVKEPVDSASLSASDDTASLELSSETARSSRPLASCSEPVEAEDSLEGNVHSSNSVSDGTEQNGDKSESNVKFEPGCSTKELCSNRTLTSSLQGQESDHIVVIKQQLREAIEADSSVIPSVVELLRDSIEGGAGANAAAWHLAETLRAMAASDLIKMRIRVAGGVRPIMAVVTQAQDESVSMASSLGTRHNGMLAQTSSTKPDSPLTESASHGKSPCPAAPVSTGIVQDVEKVEDVRLSGIHESKSIRTMTETATLQQHGEFLDTKTTLADCGASSLAFPGAASQSTGKLLGEAWLATELPLSTAEGTACWDREPGLVSVPAVSVPVGEASQLPDDSTDRIYCIDDIGVRFGGPSDLEFDYCSKHERIVSQPMGFRRWFATHSIVNSMKARALAAAQDLTKMKALLDSLQHEEQRVLTVMGMQKSPEMPQEASAAEDFPAWEDSHVAHHNLLQREIAYALNLKRHLERECALYHTIMKEHTGNDVLDTEANPIAELHLLESTFKVLQEISHP